MRALLLFLATLMPFVAGAEQLASALSESPNRSASCRSCLEMEKLRKNVFVAAQHDTRLNDKAMGALEEVFNIADRLKETEPNRLNPAEVESFFMLAVDAFPFDESRELIESIAYLKINSGADQSFERVMNEIPRSCLKTYLLSVVENNECELLNGLDQDAAQDQGRKPLNMQCKAVKGSVERCTNKLVSSAE